MNYARGTIVLSVAISACLIVMYIFRCLDAAYDSRVIEFQRRIRKHDGSGEFHREAIEQRLEEFTHEIRTTRSQLHDDGDEWGVQAVGYRPRHDDTHEFARVPASWMPPIGAARIAALEDSTRPIRNS